MEINRDELESNSDKDKLQCNYLIFTMEIT